MESNDTKHTRNDLELLGKLTRLEDQVATLSSQLESNKRMISQLKLEITERDAQIRELEAKLNMAQNSLQKTAIEKIYQCREHIRNGIDEKIVTPVLTQIQKYIEAAEGLIAETRELVRNKKAQLQDGLDATSALVRQGPDQARAYLVETVIEPVLASVERVTRLARGYHHESRVWIERELVGRYTASSEKLSFAAREIPLNAKIILQTRVGEPVKACVENLPALLQGLKEKRDVLLRQSIGKIQQVLQAICHWIAEMIKGSTFWDGKQRMQTAV
ncbi:MAG: hypothetical protein ACU841_07175 [Gammaproteobacteria bacterium]